MLAALADVIAKLSEQDLAFLAEALADELAARAATPPSIGGWEIVREEPRGRLVDLTIRQIDNGREETFEACSFGRIPPLAWAVEQAEARAWQRPAYIRARIQRREAS